MRRSPAARSSTMQAAVHADLDIAEAAGDAVLIVGRDGRIDAIQH